MISRKETLFTRDFILVSLASLLLFTAFYLLLPTFPVYLTQQLQVSSTKTGIALATYTAMALVIRPVSGYLIDIHGKRFFYILSYALFAVILFFYPLAQTFMLVLIVRSLHGFSWGVATTTGSTLIVDLVPAHRRGEGIGIFGLSMTIPMALGPFIGLKLTQGSAHYNTLFVVSACIGIFAFLLTLMVKCPPISAEVPKKFVWANLIEKTAIPTAVTLLITNICYGGLVSFIAIYAMEMGIGHTALFFIVFAVGITISRVLGGKFFDKNGPKHVSFFGFLCLIGGYILLGQLPGNTSFLMAAFFTGLGTGVMMPAFQAMVNNLVLPQRRGAANSTLFTGLDLGIGLGMLLTGVLAAKIGLRQTFNLFALISLAAMLFFLFFTLKHYNKKRCR